MKKNVRRISILLCLVLSSLTLNLVHGASSISPLSYRIKTCLTVEINSAEGILHMVIEGTKQGDGTLTIKNSEGEIIYNADVKCWNERTVIDLSLESFAKGSYTVSFKSSSTSCDAEFVY